MEKLFWVEIGLWGIKTRSAALSWFYSSIFGSILMGCLTAFILIYISEVLIVLGVFIGIITGVFFSLSSLWYWLCINWMDTNRAWGSGMK